MKSLAVMVVVHARAVRLWSWWRCSVYDLCPARPFFPAGAILSGLEKYPRRLFASATDSFTT